MEAEIIECQQNTDTGLQLCRIIPNPEYLKKWNAEGHNDFYVLSQNGKLLRETLYRIGGMNNPNVSKDKYFLLLKHTEDYYDIQFMKECYPNLPEKQLEIRRLHLKAQWVILDNEGNEKFVAKEFESVYLKKNSVLFSMNRGIFNIETDHCYGYGNTFETDNFLFLENNYDKDKSKRGVLKINKQDGSYELFPTTK